MRGFTLVEVMVALAVVAIALPSLLVTLYRQSDDTAYLRDRTVAAQVAANKLTEFRLVVNSTRSLTAGRDSGETEMADRDWYWWIVTTPEEVDTFFRIEIAVALDEEGQDNPLYTLQAFMSADMREDQGVLNTGDPDDPPESAPDEPDTPDPGSDSPDDVQRPPGDGNLPPGVDPERLQELIDGA
ncbi:MAG: type II secretion system minor pseudopilin GspI [Pseudomonadota bacterium]